MKKRKHSRSDEIELINGRLWVIIRGDRKMMYPLPADRRFNGSSIGKNGLRATCLNCGNKHAPGLRCAKCSATREHRDKMKPDNIKGI